MKLTRITSGGKFIPEIDGLRFVAIMSVVVFHIFEFLLVKTSFHVRNWLTLVLHNGQRGVPLFFAISGFILARPFASYYLRGTPKPNIKEYFLRRITRLEPPYAIALISVYLALAAFTKGRGSAHLFASLFYSHNLIFGAPNPSFGLAWSLEIEIQFYCLLPFIAHVYKLPKWLRRGLLLTAMCLGSIYFLPVPQRIHLSLLGWIQCFAAGMLFADFYLDGWNESSHTIFDLMSLLLWPTVFLLNDMANWILLPAITLTLYIAAFRSRLFRHFFRLRIITIIGGMCYTIYLVHYPVISAVGRLFRSPFEFICMALLSTAIASLIFFLTIERPCMKRDWPSRLTRSFGFKNKYSTASKLNNYICIVWSARAAYSARNDPNTQLMTACSSR
jgi:peptidoglycan/LPS O-acetylase OafA/YrhL